MVSCRCGVNAFPALVSGWPAKPVMVSGTGLSMRKMELDEAHCWLRTNTFAPVSNKAWIVLVPSGVSSFTSLINLWQMIGSRKLAFLWMDGRFWLALGFR